MQQTKCWKCGTLLPENASFCPRCGAGQRFDAALVPRGAAGDQAALTELYEKTHSGVYHCIRSLIKDEDTALDVLQDSYLKAFGSLEQLQDPSRFGAWIRRIARNRALDVLRQKRLVSFSELETDDDSPLFDFEDDRPEHLPEIVIEQQETTRLMNEILDALPEEQRTVISLFYYDQLSVTEIAETLQVSENTVKSRLNYGRKKVETGVRALEKKGTRLYGLAPVPFLLLLFRSQAASAAEVPAAVAKAVTAGAASAAGSATSVSGTTGGTAAAGKAAAAAGKTAVKAAGHALRTRLLIGAAAATVAVGGGTAAYIHFSEAPAEPAPSRTVETTRKEQILSDDFLRHMKELAVFRLASLYLDHEALELKYRGGSVDIGSQYILFENTECLPEAIYTETGGVTSFYLLYRGELRIMPDWPAWNGPISLPERIPEAVAVFTLDTFPLKFRLPDGSMRYKDENFVFLAFYESEEAFYAALKEDLKYVSHDYYELTLP